MKALASSYRDPDGFMFQRDGLFYRLVNPSYYANLDLLHESGLYKKLADAGQLIAHTEIQNHEAGEGRLLLPQQIPFISYPYEWCFDMWKEAALLTLSIAKRSLAKGMTLKDATPFNIQFLNGRAVFIDTLSFEKYESGKPWIAYRQFCECFLAPLLLMHYCHRDAAKIFLSYPNGMPLDMLKSLLPAKAKWNLHVYLHVWLQAKVSSKNKTSVSATGFSKEKLKTLLNGLETLVNKCTLKKSRSTWDDYYTDTILSDQYLSAKAGIIKSFADKISFKTITDLGANDGYFSLLLKDKATSVVAVDADSNCINEFYRVIKKDGIQNIIPIVAELNNPSPAIGWAHKERTDLSTRLEADLVLALALVHHLAVGLNVHLPMIAEWLAPMCTYLIVEFVPKSDEKVKQLLQNRQDVFPNYDPESFRYAFKQYFEIVEEQKAGDTERIIFLMQKK